MCELESDWTSKNSQGFYRQKPQDQTSIKMDHTLKMRPKWSEESHVLICFPCFGTVHWHTLDGRVWQVSFQSWSMFFKWSTFTLHLLVSWAQGINQRKGLHFTEWKIKKDIRPFPQRGMKEFRRVPFKSQLNPSVFPLERQLFIHPDCAATLWRKPVSFPSLWLCVNVRECLCKSVIASISMAMMSHSIRHLPW